MVSLLLLAGCGKSPEDKVADTINTWMDALVDRDGDKACGQMTAAGSEEFGTIVGNFVGDQPGPRSCEETVELLGEAAREAFGEPKVSDVRIDGDRATAKATGAPPRIDLRREGDDWRIEHSVVYGWRAIGIPDYSKLPRK